tara:strand:+ start:2704 stop:2931 length:228 start_codon:yes stop_codon:yes gene_type:complete
MREVIRGKRNDPQRLSLVIVYTLAKALAISPLEIYKMPASLVSDLLIIHSEIEMMKAEELDKISSETKTQMNSLR